MCDNYEQQWLVQQWVERLLWSQSFLYLVAEYSQNILKISVIPIFLTSIYLVALNLLVNNQLNVQLNSSLRHIIVTLDYLFFQDWEMRQNFTGISCLFKNCTDSGSTMLSMSVTSQR